MDETHERLHAVHIKYKSFFLLLHAVHIKYKSFFPFDNTHIIQKILAKIKDQQHLRAHLFALSRKSCSVLIVCKQIKLM